MTKSAELTIIDALDDPALFAPWFPGDTWWGWRVILKAAFGLPLAEDEMTFFRQVAEREPPGRQVKELWIVVGRRGGKDSIASAIAAFVAAMFSDQDRRLRPGERALVACLATDRDQARIIHRYTKAYFAEIPLLAGMLGESDGTATSFELDNDVDVSILTSNFRAVRGRPILCAVLDECAFWRDDTSANPDLEVYAALVPGLASLPGSILIGISSPYAKSGLLYKKFNDHYGKNTADVLVIKAPTRVLNPTIDQAVIDAAMADDPARATAEWLAEFRDDVQGFLTREVIDAATVPGRHELPPLRECSYCAFVDPSGGSSDSMTLAISHLEGDRAVLDLIRERRPPFSPDDVVAEFAETLRSYRIISVRGDRYGGEWPRERFRAHGIDYEITEKPKSDIYRDFLPRMNSGAVELLEHQRLSSQLAGLERRTARSGRDSIDHQPGAHDDIANAVAGSLLLAFGAAATSWQRDALMPHSAPLTDIRSDLVFAVLVSDKRGGGAVVYFAWSKVWSLKAQPLLILDAAAALLSSAVFEAVAARLSELTSSLHARQALLFTSGVLADEARRLGCRAENIDVLLANEESMLALAADVHIGAGRVKAITPELAAKVLSGISPDDPMRLAALIGVILTLDKGRSLARRAA